MSVTFLWPLGVISESQDLIDSSSPALLALEPSDGGLQQSLVLAKRNVSELRLQLNQLRQLQVTDLSTVYLLSFSL